MFDPLTIVVSKNEVLAGNITPALDSLKQLIESPELARSYKENVDIAFDGYNDYQEELFEIQEVRDYVHRLDEKFPFWLYFLSKKHLGLQALLLCFLPPYLKEEAKQEIFPERIDKLLSGRWFPALNHIGDFVEMDENENKAITERTVQYIFKGPLRIKGIVKKEKTALKPDYGTYLINTGINKSAEHGFYDVPIDHLIRVDFNTVTSMVNILKDNQEYAVSFDITNNNFDDLLRALPEQEKGRAHKWLSDVDTSQSTLEFNVPVTIRSITATPGESQTGQYGEVFVPLIVSTIT